MEELAMAHIAQMSQSAPSGRLGAAVPQVAHVVQRTPRIAYLGGRATCVPEGLRFVYDAPMPLHIVSALFVEARTLRLSAHAFEPYQESRFIERWFVTPSSIDAWAEVIEPSKLLRFLAAVQWMTFFKYDDLLGQAFRCEARRAPMHPSAQSLYWRQTTPRVIAFAPAVFGWEEWHGRYYTYLLDHVAYFLCPYDLLERLTCRYLDVDFPPPLTQRRAYIQSHEFMRRVGLGMIRDRDDRQVAWDKYVGYLAEECRVPRTLIERRFRANPVIRTAQEYLRVCEGLLADLPELATWRRRVAREVWPNWQGYEGSLALWLAEPLTLLPTPVTLARR
jgi:hypothetical protein